MLLFVPIVSALEAYIGQVLKHVYYYYRLNHRPFFKARLEQSLQISDVIFHNPNSTLSQAAEDRSRAASMQPNNSVCVSLTVSTSERHLPREAQQEHLPIAGG